MAANANRDFAALLDDLFVAQKPEEDDAPAQPTIPFDYLAVADELHSGRIKVAGDAVAAEYRESEAFDAEFEALLQQADPTPVKPEPVAEALPPVEADAIAAELGLGGNAAPGDLGRMRRDFAFKNHPDRVAPHLRQRAMVRMQVANMLIDDAKRVAAARPR